MNTVTAPIPATAVLMPLRRVLALDALTCLAMGLLLVTGTDALARWLALPASLLWWAGLALFPCAALMGLISRWGPTATPPRPGVALILAGNLAWAAASAGVLLWYSPNGLGQTFVVVQALAVLVLSALEWRGLRAG